MENITTKGQNVSQAKDTDNDDLEPLTIGLIVGLTVAGLLLAIVIAILIVHTLRKRHTARASGSGTTARPTQSKKNNVPGCGSGMKDTTANQINPQQSSTVSSSTGKVNNYESPLDDDIDNIRSADGMSDYEMQKSPDASIMQPPYSHLAEAMRNIGSSYDNLFNIYEPSVAMIPASASGMQNRNELESSQIYSEIAVNSVYIQMTNEEHDIVKDIEQRSNSVSSTTVREENEIKNSCNILDISEQNDSKQTHLYIKADVPSSTDVEHSTTDSAPLSDVYTDRNVEQVQSDGHTSSCSDISNQSIREGYDELEHVYSNEDTIKALTGPQEAKSEDMKSNDNKMEDTELGSIYETQSEIKVTGSIYLQNLGGAKSQGTETIKVVPDNSEESEQVYCNPDTSAAQMVTDDIPSGKEGSNDVESTGIDDISSQRMENEYVDLPRSLYLEETASKERYNENSEMFDSADGTSNSISKGVQKNPPPVENVYGNIRRVDNDKQFPPLEIGEEDYGEMGFDFGSRLDTVKTEDVEVGKIDLDLRGEMKQNEEEQDELVVNHSL